MVPKCRLEAETRKELKVLPFLFSDDSELTRWRAATFWTKEPETLRWLENVTSPESEAKNLIDVGANVGLYSLYAATLNSSLKVIAVEPAIYNFRELHRNVELNALQNQITTVLCALGSENGESRLSSIDQRVGSSGAQLDSSKVLGEMIEVRTIDSVIATLCGASSAAKSVAVKIDTDGNEFDVLLGAEVALKERAIHSILVETHPHNRLEISVFLKRFGMFEDLNWLTVEGHSNHRRKSAGKVEETKVFTYVGD